MAETVNPQQNLGIDTFAEAYFGQEALGSVNEFAGVNYQRTEDGYFILDTGNRVMDAIGSVALNELGVDNFVNAVEAAQGGSYGKAMLQLGYGVLQLGLNLTGAGTLVKMGARGAAAATRAVIRVGPNALRAARSAIAQRGLLGAIFKRSPNYSSYMRSINRAGVGFRFGTGRHTQRAARQAGLYWDDTARSFRRIADNRRVAPPQNIGGRTPLVGGLARNRRRAVSEAIAQNVATNTTRATAVPASTQRVRYLLGQPVQGVNVAGATPVTNFGVTQAAGGFSGFLGSPTARTVFGTLGAAEGYQIAQAAREANRNAEAAARQQAPGNWDRNVEQVRADSISRQVDDAVSAVTPLSVEGPAPDPDIDALDTNAQAALSAIQGQYNRAVGELRSMYQLAETEDEKERLKFVLSDIQAQADAGREAIMNVYERNRKQVTELSAQSKAAAIEAAQKALDNYEMSAASLQDQLDANFAAAAGDTYGFGAAVPREQSEYVQLLSAMAPVASQYRQAIGDISTEGLEWMGATMGEQTAARQADLQRLALSTSAAATSQHKQAVDKRIAAERLALADAMESLMNQQMQQSGANYRALVAQQEEAPQAFTPTEIDTYLMSLALQGQPLENIISEYQVKFAGKPNPLGGVYPTTMPEAFRIRVAEGIAEYEASLQLTRDRQRVERDQLDDALGIVE